MVGWLIFAEFMAGLYLLKELDPSGRLEPQAELALHGLTLAGLAWAVFLTARRPHLGRLAYLAFGGHLVLGLPVLSVRPAASPPLESAFFLLVAVGIQSLHFLSLSQEYSSYNAGR